MFAHVHQSDLLYCVVSLADISKPAPMGLETLKGLGQSPSSAASICAAASFTRWTNPSQMTRAGPAPGPGCAQPLPYVCLPCIPHMDGYAMCMFTRARDPLLRRKSSPAEQGCECVRVSVCDLHACARVGAAGLSPAADRVFGRASAAHPA